METICLRLCSGDNLREAIYKVAKERNIKAGIILTCVGSLQTINIRLAGGEQNISNQDKYEILSLSGTFNQLEQGHFHIAVADNKGDCLGGHLLSDNIVATTAELILGILPGKQFLREQDPTTGYLELIIKNDLPR
jgi:predicted DNA-binding protein with PD1-like motif